MALKTSLKGKLAMSDKQQITCKTFRLTQTADKKNWVYERWNDNPGINSKTGEQAAPNWSVVGYYGKLRDVATYLINSQIEVPARGFENAAKVLAAIKELEASLAEQLEELTKE